MFSPSERVLVYFVLSWPEDLPSRHGSTHQSMPFIVPSAESSISGYRTARATSLPQFKNQSKEKYDYRLSVTARITRGNCHIKQIRVIVIAIKVEAIGRTIPSSAGVLNLLGTNIRPRLIDPKG